VGLFENIFQSDVKDLHNARYTKKIEQLWPNREKQHQLKLFKIMSKLIIGVPSNQFQLRI
jgi:hypothetical protein